jgi:hypothetical protein
VAEKNSTKNILGGRTEVKQYTPLPWGYNYLSAKGLFQKGNTRIVKKRFKSFIFFAKTFLKF